MSSKYKPTIQAEPHVVAPDETDVAKVVSPNGTAAPAPGATFVDEYVGKGGSYVIGEDGIRRPAGAQ